MGKKTKWLGNAELNNGSCYSVRASEHAVARMAQRQVDSYAALSAILALGEATLTDLRNTGDEAMVIDSDAGFALVLGFKKNTLFVITAIGKDKVFVKKGTRTYKLND